APSTSCGSSSHGSRWADLPFAQSCPWATSDEGVSRPSSRLPQLELLQTRRTPACSGSSRRGRGAPVGSVTMRAGRRHRRARSSLRPMAISKVLIANRGEIAVRVARACRDAGLGSVAVYAEPDRDALHVKVADEAYARGGSPLGGSTPGESYLVQEKLLEVAKEAGADAVHPGYGFLSENAEFAQAVMDAGLTWIGPPPAAIDGLGDKAKAKHIAAKADAPLAPGSKDPVENAAE